MRAERTEVPTCRDGLAGNKGYDNVILTAVGLRRPHGPRLVSRVSDDPLRMSRAAQAELRPHRADDSKDSQERHDLIVMELARIEEIGGLDKCPIGERADDDARRPEHREDQQWCPPRLHKVENEEADKGRPAHRDDGFDNRDWHRRLPCWITLSAFRTNPLKLQPNRHLFGEETRSDGTEMRRSHVDALVGMHELDVRVRPARQSDIPALVSVSNSSVDEDAGFGTPRSQSSWSDVSTLSAVWKDPNWVRGEEAFVAEMDGRVVGVVTIEDRGDALELINIDVAGELQGRGIGTRLVRHVEGRARAAGKRAVTLGTSRSAAGVAWKSLPWWQSLGYRITGEEENDWTRSIGPGVREIRMRKDLLRTSEVILRDVAEADLPIFFEHQRDPAANYMAAFTARDPTNRDAFTAHWKRILNDDTVIVKTIEFQGDVVGSVAKFVDEEFGKPEITYWIGKEYWGMGLATKALSEFLRDIRVRPIYGRAAKDNVASIRVMEKCGFVISGYANGFANARGKEIEEVILELSEPLAH